MENAPVDQQPNIAPVAPAVAGASVPLLCPQCHQPVLPTAYFCPNCGKSLKEAPLSKSVGAQAWLYIFSIVLPIICYIGVTRWQGFKYMRSDDPEAKQIGMVATALLAISSVITFWLGAVWLQSQIQSAVNSTSNLGGF